MSTPAAPADTLYLWYLSQPQTPVPIGELNLVMNRRGVSLRYADDWLAHRSALSEDLPLNGIEHFLSEKDTAVGAVDDARPDRWGERVIRLLDRPPRLSVLEYLYYAGDDRFGALSVSTSRDIYQPREIRPLPKLAPSTRSCVVCWPKNPSTSARKGYSPPASPWAGRDPKPCSSSMAPSG